MMSLILCDVISFEPIDRLFTVTSLKNFSVEDIGVEPMTPSLQS